MKRMTDDTWDGGGFDNLAPSDKRVVTSLQKFWRIRYRKQCDWDPDKYARALELSSDQAETSITMVQQFLDFDKSGMQDSGAIQVLTAEAFEAASQYDDARGVPLEAFITSRLRRAINRLVEGGYDPDPIDDMAKEAAQGSDKATLIVYSYAVKPRPLGGDIRHHCQGVIRGRGASPYP